VQTEMEQTEARGELLRGIELVLRAGEGSK
jgi:hypothetical protein